MGEKPKTIPVSGLMMVLSLELDKAIVRGVGKRKRPERQVLDDGRSPSQIHFSQLLWRIS